MSFSGDCTICLGGGRKRELLLSSPLLAAAGTLGDGRELAAVTAGAASLGAYITPVLTRHRVSGLERSHVVPTTAGYVIRTGRRNLGLRRALRRHEKRWSALGVPVIAALYGRDPAELGEMISLTHGWRWIDGLELHFEANTPVDLLGDCVWAAAAESNVACLVCVPFATAVEAAFAAQEAGADGLVVAAPPLARARSETGGWISGALHSPALRPLYLQRVWEVGQNVDLPIIGRGGIASVEDVIDFCAAGAVAVQLDSILYVEPGAFGDIYAGLVGKLEQRGLEWQAFRELCSSSTT